tara:strand:+ start:3384 stop:4475 length:1092 start_codon:yes stop_codon:yes gene_type:complete
MKKTLKIGRNRDKARIWIEGQALAAEGWKKGDEFVALFYFGKILYEKRRTRLNFGTYRKVAGGENRPIIDTNTDKIRDSLGDATHAEIHITASHITITPGKAPSKGVLAGVVALALVASTFGAPYISQFKRGAQRVLVACEESGIVRDELIRLGHDAVSCDILDTRNPYGAHIKGDVRPYLKGDWDAVAGFAPCTYIASSAAYAFKDPDYDRYPGVGYHQKLKPDTLRGADRRAARADAIAFVKEIEDSCDRTINENPKGYLSSMWRKPDQIIQPYWFGDAESKETCLWLKGIGKLVPTDVLDIEEHGYQVAKGKHAGKWRWKNQSPCGAPTMPPSADRAKTKAVTYMGVARAIALAISGGVV